MHNDYADIRDGMMPREPLWWDEHAVPRYCGFHPDQVADIYASEAILYEVTCQGCGHAFRVAESRSKWDEHPRLIDLIRNRALHFGDPPNIGCCASGPTMNSEPRRVLEYWHRHHREYVRDDGIVIDVPAYFEWRRISAAECDITPDWVSAVIE